MKKFIVVMMVLALGGVAYGSSVGVPWFIDTGAAANKLPPITPGVVGMVYLHNNLPTPVTCSIEYFTASGAGVGPAAPNNTFVVEANASLGFRPAVSDPSSVPGGQENTASGWLVPDRPLDTAIPGNDGKKNGSCVITWVGGASDIQGMYMQQQFAGGDNYGKLMGYAHLLPPGA